MTKRYDETKQWYAIHTYSGYEEKVAERIRQRAESLDMKDKIFEVLVPKEKMIEIKNGKRTRMLRNPSYSGITTEFWNAMDAICSRDEWVLWGTPHCGKGQPQQVMGTGHGASPARFKGVKVGSAYKGAQ